MNKKFNIKEWRDTHLNEAVKMPFSKNDWDVKWNVAKGTRKDSEVAVNARWKAIRGLMGGEHKSIRRFVKETTIWKSLTYDEFVKWYTQLLKELS
jgi:hypothetical protein